MLFFIKIKTSDLLSVILPPEIVPNDFVPAAEAFTTMSYSPNGIS